MMSLRREKVLVLVLLVGLVQLSSSFPTEPLSSSSGDDETTTMSPSAGDSSDAVVVESQSDESESENESESDDADDFESSRDCFLEKAIGPCRANIESFYYNGKECELFMWSGCQGNNNRFSEKSLCEKRCKGAEAAVSSKETETTLSPRVGETTPTTTTASTSTSTTNAPSSTTSSTSPAPSTATAAAVTVKSKPKVDCPKFEGCAKQCIVLQEQSNHGCRRCQCPADTEVDINSSVSSSRSIKTTRSTSKLEAKSPAVGSVSGLPQTHDEDEESKEEARTEKPEDVCNLPQPPRSNCRAMLTRFRYNAKKSTCEEFHFGGQCDESSNSNNFVTKEKCLEFCKGQ